MHIVIQTSTANELKDLVARTDAHSVRHYGSHDDSNIIVAVNGVQRPIRRVSRTHWKQGNSRSEIEVKEPLPPTEQVVTAAVLETSAHYGGHSRARSHLRLFARYSQDKFFVIDCMEVGDLGSLAPFKALSLRQAMWQSKRKLTISVLPECEWLGGTPYHPVIESSLQYNNPEPWLKKALEVTAKARTEVNLVASHLTHWAGVPSGKDLWSLIWSGTPLGTLLKDLEVKRFNGVSIEAELVLPD